VLRVDLADLASVRRAADQQRERHPRLDVLVNNAGVALVPRGRTADGYETHLGANFLGHYALTGLLLDRVLAAPAGRVVHVGSLQHRTCRIDVSDPHYDRRRYVAWTAYGQSKLALLTLMVELERRFRAAGVEAVSLGAHPGVSGTGIADDYKIRNIPALEPAVDWILDHAIPTPEEAARPSLRAATDVTVPGGAYLGPGGPFELGGPPAPARLSRRALDPGAGQAVVRLGERLTGVTLPL
jgi:NAD(P)-dependent dehydrogenase (short-subunit alcohol dehydrogenase family)